MLKTRSVGAVPRVELSPFVENEIRRGAFYMRPRRFILPQAGTGGYGIRPYVFCSGGAPAQRAVPRAEFSPFVENNIRRGAFYMRPRRFILPQAGTGGYGIRPYVFVAGGAPSQRRCPVWSFLPWPKTRSVGAHSICARGSLPFRKQARADMESAPTFFVAGGVPAQRGPRGAFLPVVRASGFILLYFIIRNLQKKTTACRQTKAGGFADILVVSSQRNAKIHHHGFLAVGQRVCRSKILHIEQNAPAMSGKCGETGDL